MGEGGTSTTRLAKFGIIDYLMSGTSQRFGSVRFVIPAYCGCLRPTKPENRPCASRIEATYHPPEVPGSQISFSDDAAVKYIQLIKTPRTM